MLDRLWSSNAHGAAGCDFRHNKGTPCLMLWKLTFYFLESCFCVAYSALAESWNTATMRTTYICWRIDANAFVMLGPSTLDGMLKEQYAQRASRKEPRALWVSQNGWEADHQDHGDSWMSSLWCECTCRQTGCWLSWILKNVPLWAPCEIYIWYKLNM